MAELIGTAKIILGRIVPESANDLITTNPEVMLAAPQGGVLNDKITDINKTLGNMGTIYSTTISGNMGTSDIVFSNSALYIPAGTYVILLNVGTVSTTTIAQLTIRAQDVGIAMSNYSSSLLTFVTFTEETKLTAYGRMTGSVSVPADARFNYFKAIRLI